MHPVVFQAGGVEKLLRDAGLGRLPEDYCKGNILEMKQAAGLFEPDCVLVAVGADERVEADHLRAFVDAFRQFALCDGLVQRLLVDLYVKVAEGDDEGRRQEDKKYPEQNNPGYDLSSFV